LSGGLWFFFSPDKGRLERGCIYAIIKL